jgi:glucose/arabinose dehydrogenase
MPPPYPPRAGTVLASLAAAAALALAGPADAQRPTTQTNPLDRSDLGRSRQDTNLKGIPVPPTVTAVERLPLSQIKLPRGFSAEVWAHSIPGARTMIQGPKGTYFVGTRSIGRVYAVIDRGATREQRTIIQGLSQPNGLMILDGALYVFAINKVLRYDNIEDRLDNLPNPVDLSDKLMLPAEAQHGWKYVKIGPDGKVYVPVGVPCNICEVNPGVHGHLRRYDPKDWTYEIVARGVRNTVGFDWHPVTKELWFTDNGRDWMGDDGPQDELNRIPRGREGAHFGYPYCHAQGIPDPDVKVPNPCANTITAAALMGPHSAALGMIFYTGSMFPPSYRNAMLIARHGSWNRSKRFGYDVVVARARPDGRATVEPFLTGWLDEANNKFLARPTDVFQMKDGSILVSDEFGGALYRISYKAPVKTAAP